MWQTIFHIPLDIAGIPVFGVGLLLGLWAVFGIGSLAWLAYRQGFNADTLSYIPILLIMGAIFVWLLPVLCDEHGLPIRGFGSMMLLGVVAAAALAVWRAKRIGLDSELVYSLALWMIIPGIIAARFFYVVEYWQSQYWPIYLESGVPALIGSLLNITQGGLVVYGGFIAGTAGLLLFAHKHKFPALALADLIAPSMVLGLAFGRIGCLMNGCCYGDVCTLPWAITFPPDSYAYFNQVQRGQMYGFTLGNDQNSSPVLVGVEPGSPAARAGLKKGDLIQKIDGLLVSSVKDAFEHLPEDFYKKEPLRIETAGGKTAALAAAEILPRSLPVHPTQIYSAVDALLIFFLLLSAKPFCRRDGVLFALMVSVYSVTRFFIEILRTDEPAVRGTGMTIAQNISLIFLIVAAALWVYVLRGKADGVSQAGARRLE